MSAADGFLSRWSRRKLDPERAIEPVAPAAPSDTPATGEPANEVEASADIIAALPRIEDLTAGTDLTQFMRAGVPAFLRQQALRRMWSLDPAIRDFVGEARDYSYDWNVPGGVPVSGPLLPSAETEATLSRMFSRLTSDADDGPESAEAEAETADAARDAGSASLQSAIADNGEPVLVLSAPDTPAEPAIALQEHASAVPAGTSGERSFEREFARLDPAPPASPEPAPRPRRHGTAIPKLD